MKGHHIHSHSPRTKRIRHILYTIALIGTVVLVIVGLIGAALFFGSDEWLNRGRHATAHASSSSQADMHKSAVPDSSKDQGKDAKDGKDGANSKDDAAAALTTPEDLLDQALEKMTLEEQCAQLIMVPLNAGEDPSALKPWVEHEHVGSVLLMGNWNGGTADVRKVTSALVSYADPKLPLFIATDQEGGTVQHLQGTGFSTIPSAYEQGRMAPEELRSNAQQWGEQLHTAGINIDLAPSADMVVIDRGSNAPIGALNRDFGLSADGTADHAIAFIQGMKQADVGATLKHYPGLGAVTGNTDFTDQGTVDTVTSENSIGLSAFTKAIQQGEPSMVMISLAIYENIDPYHPAVFSSTVIQNLLRGKTGYKGVVISDSLSASAVQGYAPTDLGVLFVQAGGDIVCLNDRSLVSPVLQGLVATAKSDPAFAKQVKEAARRVLTLKYKMNLNQKSN